MMLQRIHAALESDEQRRSRQSVQDRLASQLQTLTPRENDILPLLLEGNSNKSVGRQLSLSPRTVEIYRANILRKMQVVRSPHWHG